MYLIRLLLTTLAILLPTAISATLIGVLVKFRYKLPAWLYWVLFVLLLLGLLACIGFTVIFVIAVFQDLGSAFTSGL